MHFASERTKGKNKGDILLFDLESRMSPFHFPFSFPLGLRPLFLAVASR